MPGVEGQLAAHLAMGMNTGLTEDQLRQVFDLIEKNVSREQAETAVERWREFTNEPMTEKTNMQATENKNEGAIFPKGERAPAEYFTGTVYLQMLAPED